MKRTILISSLALLFVFAIQVFTAESGSAKESKTAGVVFVYSDSKNAPGSYSGTTSGSFTTGPDGFKKLSLPNGTYTICVSGTGGGAVTVVVTESTIGVNCNNGVQCPSSGD